MPKKLKLSKKAKLSKPNSRDEEKYLDQYNPPDLIYGFNLRSGTGAFSKKVRNYSQIRKSS